MSFNVGSGQPGSTFKFGQATGGSGFSFGSTSNATSSGFCFGVSATSAPSLSSGGFSFNTPVSSSTAPTVFSLGGSSTTTVAQAKPSTGFSFGPPTTAPAISTSVGGLNFSGGTKPLGMTNSLNTSKPPILPGLSGYSSASTSTAGFNLGATTVNTTGGFTLTSSSTAPTLGTTGQSSAVPSFSNPASFGAPTSSGSIGSNSTTATTSSVATKVGIVTTASSSTLKQVSYKELEDTIDQWLHDLNEQEKAFLNQSTQVNVWDRQLIENGEKISEVHSEVERLKAEQGRLDRELEFILTQQQELEGLLAPIEAQVNAHPLISHTQHADVERERTYRLAENIDSQLKHMMQSLNEIIDHINSSNINPSKSTEDPVSQIAKILNAHMDSLQWIDQNTNKLQQRVKEVSQVLDVQRKEQERSFHLGYE